MITVRASTLDRFGTYLDPDVDFVSAEEIEAKLRQGQDDGAAVSDAAALGTEFHKAVQSPAYDGDLFDASSVALVRDGLDCFLTEVAGSTVLDVDGVPVCVTGHADFLLGAKAVEIKTSSRPIPYDRYLGALQWRCYCLIFGVREVEYRCVELAERRGRRYAVALSSVSSCYAYPRLRDDVTDCLRELLRFARLRGCLDAMEVPNV